MSCTSVLQHLWPCQQVLNNMAGWLWGTASLQLQLHFLLWHFPCDCTDFSSMFLDLLYSRLSCTGRNAEPQKCCHACGQVSSYTSTVGQLDDSLSFHFVMISLGCIGHFLCLWGASYVSGWLWSRGLLGPSVVSKERRVRDGEREREREMRNGWGEERRPKSWEPAAESALLFMFILST